MAVIGDGFAAPERWAVEPERRHRSHRGTLASLFGHAVVALLLTTLRPTPLPHDPAVASLAVELVAPSPPPPRSTPPVVAPADRPAVPVPAAAPPAPRTTAPPPPPLPPPPPASAAAAPPTPPEAPAMVRPTRLLSAAALDDPRSRAARRDLAAMAADERAIQLCGLEAMAQVAAWKASLSPDRIVAYATAEVVAAGDTLVADGAAIHGQGHWWRLGFRCELSPDRRRVAGFAFRVGDSIPRRDLERFGLPESGEALD
jgi:hypothetical protein